MPRPTTTLNRHVGSLLLIASLALIAIAKEVLVPIVLATMLAVLLTPLVAWLVRRRVPNLLAVGMVVGSLSIVTVLVGTVILRQFNQVADQLVEYRQNIHQRLSEISTGDGAVSKAAGTIKVLQHELGTIGTDAKPEETAGSNTTERTKKGASKPIAPQPVEVVSDRRTSGMAELMPLLISSLQPLAVIGLTFLLATFMIVQREDLQRRFGLLSEWMSKRGMSTLEGSAVDDITHRIGSYLLLQSVTNIAAGAVVALVVYFLGLPNALLWGMLTALLRYVPYLGIIIAAGTTILFAIAVSPNWSLPVEIFALFLAVELIIGNVVEPLVFAHGTGLSSLGILVATAFWTWIWGPMGLFLAIPLTVCVVAIGRQSTSLGYLYILLGEPLPEPRVPSARAADV